MNTKHTTDPKRMTWLKKSSLLILPAVIAMGLLIFQISIVRGAASLTVDILAGYNLVVDSNVKSPSTFGPSVATVAGRFCNPATNSDTLRDVVGYIGDYTGGVNTPGLYPVKTMPASGGDHPLLADSGSYSFTHLGSAPDATRYIGDLAPGQCKVEYWSFTYPRCEGNAEPPCLQDAVWGDPADLTDDLDLAFDVWGTGTVPGGISITEARTHTMTMRSEISAMANKIKPNPDGVWFNTETSTVNAGDVITTNGVNYTFGNVTKGFDNDGDGVYDNNAWMQPFGAPSYDPSCFRLVRTTGTLTVTRSGGNPPLILPISDQLYFSNLPADNVNVTGRVYYTFLALGGACQAAMTPYQEAASGTNNEKFNGDFGAAIPPLVSHPPQVTVDKTAPDRASEGTTFDYQIPFANIGNTAVGLTLTSGYGITMPFTIEDSVPAGLEYVCDSANASLDFTPAPYTDDYTVIFSRDNGTTWTADNPGNCTAGYALSTEANPITIQWRLKEPLPAVKTPNTSTGTAQFSVRIPANYISAGGDAIISNQACANLAGAAQDLDCGESTTLVQGNNSIGDLLWRDENFNGIQDSGEAGINGVTVWLYWDKLDNGTLDADDPRVAITTSALNGSTDGYYSFTGLPNASYLVMVDLLDTDVPTGYSLTTGRVQAVTNQLTGSTAYTLADFGFGPALNIDKNLVSPSPLFGGEIVTYTIDLMNNLPGDGTANNFCQYKVWASIHHNGINQPPLSGGNDNSRFTDPDNALGPPDGLISAANMKNTDDLLGLSGFNLAGVTGVVTDVKLQLYIKELSEMRDVDKVYLDVYRSNNETRRFTYSGLEMNRPSGSSYIFTTPTITGTWSLANFTANDTELQIETTSHSASGNVGIDAVAYIITTDQVCGGPDTTIASLPLTDTYDADLLQFISAVPAPASVVTDQSEPYDGLITWNNLGPLYAGGKTTATVVFRALQPYTTPPQASTNYAGSTGGHYGNGRLVNNDYDSENFSVQTGGAITGTIFANTTASGGWVAPTGHGSGDTFIPNVRLELRACVNADTGLVIPTSVVSGNNVSCSSFNGVWRTIATQTTNTGGKYAFTGLRDGYYNVVVVASTLPTNLNQLSLETNSAASGGINCLTGTCDNQWEDESRSLTGSTGGIANFNPVGIGEIIPNVSFGYISATAQGVVSGFVWNDRDEDGVWDAGEEPIPGVSVNVCVAGTSTCIAATTDPTGYYQAARPAGSYTITVTAPGGMTQTGDPDLPNNSCGENCDNTKSSFTLAASQMAGLYNFGYSGGYRIGDTVYTDWNGDGDQDSGEEGIPGVTLSLYRDWNYNGSLDTGEPLLTSTVTNANGIYLFTGLAGNDNDYLVVLSRAGIPAGYAQTGDPNETGKCTLCDAKSPVLNLNADSLGNDFGFQPQGYGAIGDSVWFDANGDGVQNTWEAGIPGVIVHLYHDEDRDGDIDAGVDALVGIAATNDEGIYSFSGLFPTSYIVQVQPENFEPDQPLDRLMQTNGSSHLQAATLGIGETNNSLDFGYASSILGGTIWRDTNGDGTQSAGENGIPDVWVTLYSSLDSGTSWQIVASRQTASDGSYQFSGLTAGYYRVAVTDESNVLSGYTLTYDPDAYSKDPVNYPPPVCIPSDITNFVECNAVSTTDLQLGRIDMTHDFGYQGPGSIGDFVWIDSDADGEQDPGEAGIGGVLVTLDPPAGVNLGAGDGVPVTIRTDSDGYYSFGGLADSLNAYTISISHPTGMVVTYDADDLINGATSFQMSGGKVSYIDTSACPAGASCDLDLDFGLKYDGTLTISGTVFMDLGTKGQAYNPSADIGLSNIVVYLYRNNQLVAITTTNTSGGYSFGSLTDGGYTVVVDKGSPQLIGMTQTYAPGVDCTNPANTCSNVSTITLAGSSTGQVDFGYYADMDCGDLPAANNVPAGEYRTLLGTEGPCHIGTNAGVSLTRLGTLWDAETDGQPSASAIGDDNNLIDEDGVTPLNFYTWTQGGTGDIRVVINGDYAYLAAWFDWNNNRRFASPVTGQYDPGEFVYFGALAPGEHNLTVNIPASPDCCSTNRNLYARFRVYRSMSGPPLVSPTGNAVDGEVEDYMWGNAPTAVTMGPLAVTVVDRQATLTWLTAMEKDAIGFNVYRTRVPHGNAVKLNSELIPSQGEGIGGAYYEWQDTPPAPGVYEYWVEFIDIYGSHYFGPATAIMFTNTYLPLVGR